MTSYGQAIVTRVMSGPEFDPENTAMHIGTENEIFQSVGMQT